MSAIHLVAGCLLPVSVSFVDRDMFLRYTDLGIGHPASLRKTIRDCSGRQRATPAGAMDANDGVDSDGEDHEEDDDEQMDMDLAADEEDEDGDEDGDEDEDEPIDGDGLDDLEEEEESDCELSF